MHGCRVGRPNASPGIQSRRPSFLKHDLVLRMNPVQALVSHFQNKCRCYNTSKGVAFVAVDVCAELGLLDTQSAICLLPEDEMLTIKPENSKAGESILVLTERALYRLVCTSETPQAKDFFTQLTGSITPSVVDESRELYLCLFESARSVQVQLEVLRLAREFGGAFGCLNVLTLKRMIPKARGKQVRVELCKQIKQRLKCEAEILPPS